jgi:cystathionine gamma-lyase
MKYNTKIIHSGQEPDPSTGAIMTPIFLSSTFVQESPGTHQGYEYSRSKNPTRSALEKSLASLENGKHAYCFSSGMAATDTVMKLLKPGDEVVATSDLYGGSYRLFSKTYAPFGIKFHFVPFDDLSQIERIFNSNTRLLWIESPTNPVWIIPSLRPICKIRWTWVQIS